MRPTYEFEGARLFTGDALQVLRELPPRSVDAVVADPPYSSGGMFRGDRTQSTGDKYLRADADRRAADFTGDNRDQRSYAYWSHLWMGECLRVARPGGHLLVFSDWRQLPTTSDVIQAAGWVWRGVAPWVKPSYRPLPDRLGSQCEYVLHGTNGAIARGRRDGAYLPGFFEGSAPKNREHQTQKPLNVMCEILRLCPDGGTVLDPFMGSGTTAVAAVTTGRKFIGVELSDHYASVAEKRIRAALLDPDKDTARGLLL